MIHIQPVFFLPAIEYIHAYNMLNIESKIAEGIEITKIYVIQGYIMKVAK